MTIPPKVIIELIINCVSYCNELRFSKYSGTVNNTMIITSTQVFAQMEIPTMSSVVITPMIMLPILPK